MSEDSNGECTNDSSTHHVGALDAEHVAKELFTRVGIPGLLAELYRLLKIQPIKTSPYHPQTDGLIGRFNQTLKAMLCKTAIEERPVNSIPLICLLGGSPNVYRVLPF